MGKCLTSLGELSLFAIEQTQREGVLARPGEREQTAQERIEWLRRNVDVPVY
jgi:hypothetical protein